MMIEILAAGSTNEMIQDDCGYQSQHNEQTGKGSQLQIVDKIIEIDEYDE